MSTIELDEAFDSEMDELDAVEQAKVMDAQVEGDRIPCRCVEVSGDSAVTFRFETLHGESFEHTFDVPESDGSDLHRFVEQFGYTVQNMDMMVGETFMATKGEVSYTSGKKWNAVPEPTVTDKPRRWGRRVTDFFARNRFKYVEDASTGELLFLCFVWIFLWPIIWFPTAAEGGWKYTLLSFIVAASELFFVGLGVLLAA